jgi:hypothetical protein
MTDLATARELVTDYLCKIKARMNSFGSVLLGYPERPKDRFVIVDTREYDFGWIFFYNTKGFADSGDHLQALTGNSPLIVDRADGRLYVTGTAHPLEHYIKEYRKGVRHRAEQDTAANRR